MYPIIMVQEKKKKYRWYNFLWDIFMICITGGLWVIWIFCREMRKK